MPLLDVTEVLGDPDFTSFDLQCERSTTAVGENGRATSTPTTTGFAGVVTSADGDVLLRGAEGARVSGSITIHTVFRLSAGDDATDADVVIWRGARFVVTALNDYMHFGRGFVVATCSNLKIAGNPAP